MEKQIPIYFDSVVVSSPFKGISDDIPNIGRLKVRVFTKYGNRNGSYITDAVAEQLIESATQGYTPVVGFFDPSTQTWASHSGPKLAKGYGYVENFVGWEPFEDTDGVTREYAVFSVILFTDYYEEAKKIAGQNQSMELDPNSIDGSWTMIQNEEFFVYTAAKMLGFCIIGDHEPCFSVSSFFSKNDDDYKNQFQKFSSLLFDLKMKVEEVEKNNKGGEQPMNEFENQEVVEDTVETPVEETQVEESEVNFEEKETEETEKEQFEKVEENSEEVEQTVQEKAEPSEFEQLQQQYNELQTSYNELLSNYNSIQEQLTQANEAKDNLVKENDSLQGKINELTTSIENYESVVKAMEVEKKNGIIKDYESLLTEEDLNPIKEKIETFSCTELENELAVIFARRQINNKKVEQKTVPVLEPEESRFALLMKKYRKN